MEMNYLSQLIENNRRDIALDYYKEVKSSEYMNTYHKLDSEKVIKREEETYLNLASWLKHGANNDAAEQFFCKVGSDRFNEGFPLSELNYALFLSKKAFWNFLSEHPEIIENKENKVIIDLFAILSNYFALAGFYMVRSYINTLFEKLDYSDGLSREEIHKILIRGAFDEEDLDMSDFIWRHV
ncbi:MAG: hypothetical protein C0425_00510 [Chlorobiaceae bacterium]|nr:hypothetical protein [Chlorobiaceae bacterium]MBA4308805.1 hypothetical protein [Chlorobiaceae bacterium]